MPEPLNAELISIVSLAMRKTAAGRKTSRLANKSKEVYLKFRIID
jgi:hypothetical protein